MEHSVMGSLSPDPASLIRNAHKENVKWYNLKDVLHIMGNNA